MSNPLRSDSRANRTLAALCLIPALAAGLQSRRARAETPEPAAPEFEQNLGLVLNGASEQREAALSRILKSPAHRSRLISAWQSAQGKRRAQTLAAVTRVLSPEETARLLLLSKEGRPGNTLERYLLASALVNKTRDGAWWKERLSGGTRESLQKPWNDLREKALAIASWLANEQDWRLRLLAAELLAAFAGDRLAVCHRQLLEDTVWPVRFAALEALAALPIHENVKILKRILQQKDASEGLVAVAVLKKLRHWPGLRAGLSHPDKTIQLHSVRAIGWMLDAPGKQPSLRDRTEAIRLLKKTRDSTRNRKIRNEIAKILADIDNP